MRALRGAITVNANTGEAISEATCTLLSELQSANHLSMTDAVCVFFTLTPDLNADFPARAARGMGWDVPMLDMQEVPVPQSLPRCLRVLVLVERSEPVRHVYLRGAKVLRPDLEN